MDGGFSLGFLSVPLLPWIGEIGGIGATGSWGYMKNHRFGSKPPNCKEADHGLWQFATRVHQVARISSWKLDAYDRQQETEGCVLAGVKANRLDILTLASSKRPVNSWPFL